MDEAERKEHNEKRYEALDKLAKEIKELEEKEMALVGLFNLKDNMCKIMVNSINWEVMGSIINYIRNKNKELLKEVRKWG